MYNKKLPIVRSLLAALPVCLLQMSPAMAAPAPGGFTETTVTAGIRAVLSPGNIQSLLPQRGAFTFPAPYNTKASRLTNASDCAGNDCVNYAGYSYWRNMNNHVGMDSMLIFLGLDASRGGKGPTLLEFDKATGAVRDLGALFPKTHRLGWATGEGWYFSATMPTKLYINDGPRISRFDVITEEMTTVADISHGLGAGYMLTQMHSSDDDRVHSATVRENRGYRALGCMAFEENTNKYHYYPITGEFDECQIDRSGEWLVIKADLDGMDGEDNLIVNLRTGQERMLRDRDGAAGHSDMGHGYMIAQDNWAEKPNTWKLWDFTKSTLQGESVYSNNNWNVAAPAHVSHTNANPRLPAQQQYACGSSVNRNSGAHANEIVCLTLNGSGKSVVIAPTMTNLDAAGGDNDYARAAKGNLDVTGRYFLWTTNMGGSRLDAFIVEIPEQLMAEATNSPPGINLGVNPGGNPGIDLGISLGGNLGIDLGINLGGNLNGTAGRGAGPAPIVESSPPPASAPVLWQNAQNITSQGKLFTKTSGCDGCPDAGAVSSETLTSGNATLEFTARSYGPLFLAGFTQTKSIPAAADLVFGLRLQNGLAEVRERGVYRGDTPFKTGDRFSITINAGRVSYSRNGTVFFTSTRTVPYPLSAGSSMYSHGAALEDAVFRITPAS